MKLGKTSLRHQVATSFMSLLLLAGTPEHAHGFGSKPSDPPAPPPPPATTLKVDNPQTNATLMVGKAISISGKFTGNIVRASLLLDGSVVVSSSSASFKLAYTPSAAQLGSHTLSVVGYDKGSKQLSKTDYKVTVKAVAPTLSVENLKDGQNFNEDETALFYVIAENGVDAVEVSKNGKVLGSAEYVTDMKKYRFSHKLEDTGAFDFKFSGKNAGNEVVSKTYRVNVLAKAPPPQPSGKNFNAYLLKAVDQIRKKYGLLGYNIKAQLTHDMDYNGKGILKSTYGALTMCVSAQLELILTAYEIYAQETGDRSIYDFLPYKSWNNLGAANIKAHIWVDAKLDSYGTADALKHFGMGELTPFSELQPGSFVNINRENGTGHAVLFISYIDIKANELDHYDAAKVAGFKYFSAQGKEAVGQGGFDYRYAFFAKNGCPTIPYKRDCGLMWSTSRKYLSTGTMWHPRDWRKPASVSSEGARLMSNPLPLTQEDLDLTNRPANFNGLTTDD